MTRWNRGDPYPKNWPEWLKEADISWCDVEIGPVGYVNWLNGVWESGTWVNGTWRGGAWHSGTWWNGTWHSGTWVDGVWHNGTWRSGTWVDGDWFGGIWMDGTWGDGTWESGHQRKPRFGWSLDPDGLILGFDGEFWASKTAEEWHPLLEGMPKDKVIEFKLILTWVALKNPKIPTTETSIWDHLQEN